MKLFNLENKTAIVTGGRNGNLGPIWVETLNEAGANVEIFDLPEVDMGSYLSIFKMTDLYFTKWGHAPNIIINNAAIDNPPGSDSTFFGSFDEIVKVNLFGSVYLIGYLIPAMIKNGGGVIINIGSIQGYGGADWRNYDGSFKKPVGYNLSKWALRGLSKSLTTQYGRYGIRSVTISFGCVDTPKIKPEFAEKYLKNVPLGRMISKESLKMSLLYAVCCPDLAGVDWRIDGGLGAWA